MPGGKKKKLRKLFLNEHKNPAASLAVVFPLRPEQTPGSFLLLLTGRSPHWGSVCPPHAFSRLGILSGKLSWKILSHPEEFWAHPRHGQSLDEVGERWKELGRSQPSPPWAVSMDLGSRAIPCLSQFHQLRAQDLFQFFLLFPHASTFV